MCNFMPMASTISHEDCLILLNLAHFYKRKKKPYLGDRVNQM